ncbi:hypothetical protein [Desulfotalea psychrophila]|uniref:Uncharacterized protein n=1 Tax=Desulfotalea psychrophila (strain LSv54 / DSM 12343) TaxID=177439 RepID=Q6AKH5_DESPS|nr:hypothetical protein [Desulfotalea psychrophila]CAG37150.1 unknown protein [Desulfotalea psychrophila LSv54]
MENTATEQVAFSRSFNAYYLLPVIKYLAVLFGVLLLVILFFTMNRAKQRRMVSKAVEHNGTAQLSIAMELKKTRDNLKRVHDVLVENKKISFAVKVKDQQEELESLLFSIEQHPGLHKDGVASQDKRKIEKHNKFMQGLVRNLQVQSEKLLKNVNRGNDSSAEVSLNEVANELKNCRNKSYNNVAGRA